MNENASGGGLHSFDLDMKFTQYSHLIRESNVSKTGFQRKELVTYFGRTSRAERDERPGVGRTRRKRATTTGGNLGSTEKSTLASEGQKHHKSTVGKKVSRPSPLLINESH